MPLQQKRTVSISDVIWIVVGLGVALALVLAVVRDRSDEDVNSAAAHPMQTAVATQRATFFEHKLDQLDAVQQHASDSAAQADPREQWRARQWRKLWDLKENQMFGIDGSTESTPLATPGR